ncbi:class I SAM-dependent methyltransferase [Candidatus Woesearchaeota archaeon]|jgi:SAM-dependent methyltransferase|nr:class I SAM-dependent methyltransferase [Candidatus Woesearchaeota archaeon]MBT4387640.1 class I SAM-dependent methyltransferase [Candidatus Woesearchaeota archaeon]MBT4595997.1 class I SAM-dependent methyltransferase [Candidatus Woesearchaeota archaeon]MBT5741014.1 class I SAM-dependent methyltransferase [Candidatus Woesearchaeota archaeon]MBT6505386.1 class I SAM-dependent methyltransferase [Candidatus Woesearchaeota archaeon]
MKDYDYTSSAKHYDILEAEPSIDVFNKLLNKLLKKNKVKSVFDITCGTGAQAIFLDKNGYDVTASDYSSGMIKIAKQKYSKLKFSQGDMRKVRKGKFDSVISIFNAIGHLSKSDFEIAIKNIANNLKSNGLYIFDILNYDFMKNNFITHEFIDTCRDVDGVKYVRFNNNKLNRTKQIMSMNQKIYIQNGFNKLNISKKAWDMQIYSSNQLKKILDKNGFEVLEFLSMDGKKFDKDKSLFILTIARKKN